MQGDPMNAVNEETVVKPSKRSLVNIIIDGISGIFLPIVNILSAAGIMKGCSRVRLHWSSSARRKGPTRC